MSGPRHTAGYVRRLPDPSRSSTWRDEHGQEIAESRRDSIEWHTNAVLPRFLGGEPTRAPADAFDASDDPLATADERPLGRQTDDAPHRASAKDATRLDGPSEESEYDEAPSDAAQDDAPWYRRVPSSLPAYLGDEPSWPLPAIAAERERLPPDTEEVEREPAELLTGEADGGSSSDDGSDGGDDDPANDGSVACGDAGNPPPVGGGVPPQPPAQPPPVSAVGTVGTAGTPPSRPAPSGLAARIRSAQVGGAPLPRSVRTQIEPSLGVDLRPVRVHTDGAGDAIARELGATAVTVGADLFFRTGRYDPDSPSGGRLLAHELTHSAQQARMAPSAEVGLGVSDGALERQAEDFAGRIPATAATAGVGLLNGTPAPGALGGGALAQAYLDPTQSTYTAGEAAGMSDAELLRAVNDLRGALAGVGLEDPHSTSLRSNMDLVLSEMQRRHVALPGIERPAAATSADQLAPPGQIAALEAHYEALDRLAERELGNDAGTVRARIAERVTWLESIHRDAVLDEGARIEALQRSIGTLVQTKRVVPSRPITDPRMAAVDTGIRQSMRFAAAALLTAYERDATAALEIARADYLAGFAQMLLLTAQQLKGELPKLHDIPFVSNYEEGILTRTPGGPWEGGDDVRTYRESLDRLTTALDGYGDLGALAGASPADRLVFLAERGDALMDQIGQVQALIVAAQGIGLVAFFQQQISSAPHTFDHSRINDMRADIIEPMIAGLRMEQAPDPASIERAQYEFEHAAPEPTEEAAREAQRSRHAAYEEEHHLSGDESLTRRRLREIGEFEQRFGIFVAIAASIIGMVAASAAVGAVMRASLFAEGGALAAGQGLRIGAIRFAVQALTFTTVSQTVRGLLLGRAPTVGEALQTAAMDAATLGFMQAIGLPFTRIGQTPPTGFQFGALWAWSAGWQIGGLAWRGQLTLGSAAEAIVMSGVENAVMFKSLEIAHRLGMLPTPDMYGNLFRPRSGLQQQALRSYLEAQQQGRRVSEDAAAWARGARRPEVLDEILARSDAFLGQYRRALTEMRDTNLLAHAEAEGLLLHSVQHTSQVRNLRDAVRLGLQPTGDQLVSYNGTVGNLHVYLARLQREGTITGATPTGREGVFEVSYPDGRVRFFYPAAGGATRGPAPDFLIEAVQRALPEARTERHMEVLQAMRRLPVDVAARLLAAAEGSPRAIDVLNFVARPDVVLELSRPNSIYNAAFMQAALAGQDPATRLMARPESPVVLQRWWQTAFEGVGRGGARDISRFLSFLEQVQLYRGSLAVDSLGEANRVTQALTEAGTMLVYVPTRPQPVTSIGPVGAPPSPPPGPTPADFFLQQGFRGGMQRMDIGTSEWYFSLDAGGRLQRAWVFARGTAQPALEIDLSGALARVRQASEQLDRLGPGEETRAREIVESVRADLNRLAVLRQMRGFDVARELTLLDRVEFDPRGPNARAAQPVVDLPGPLAPPAIGPGYIYEPVTPGEILAARQSAVEQRAARMGRVGDPVVREALAAQVRSLNTLEQQSTARQNFETADRRLDELATAAYQAASQALGPGRLQNVVNNVFPGRTQTQVGEALDYMSRQPGYNPASLEQLAALPAGQREVLAQLDPALLAALGEVAARNPEGAGRLLAQRELLIELQRNPGMAARFVELAHLLTGGDLPFSDVHRHLFGGIEYPHFFVQAMTDAVMVDLPGVSRPQEIAARLRSLETATERLTTTGERLGAALPPGHRSTQAFNEAWAQATPAIAQYRAMLEQSIRDAACPTEMPALQALLMDRLQRAFTLPRETAQQGPQVDPFFPLFSTLAEAARTGEHMVGGPMRERALPAATALAETHRVAYVELRAGRRDLRLIREQLLRQGALGPDGNPLPDVRLVISYLRAGASPGGIEADLAALGPLRQRVVGIDFSGQEGRPLTAAETQGVSAVIARTNFESLTNMLAAHPDLVTELTNRIGQNPVDAGRALQTQIAATPAGEPVPAAAELARLNRQVRDLVAEIDAREGRTRLPADLLGLTIHAGEQIRSDARIDTLLNDMQTALNAGVDRIGHGIILGVALPEGLANVGFTRRADGSWSRAQAGGAEETYSPDQIAAMEAQRLRLIRQTGDEGVTLEISPTSNIVLSGLQTGSHPIAEILAARPNIRIAVTTDNPALHLTDPAQELAIASAVSGASHPQMVRFYLEGYASRLGGRPIVNAATVRARMRDALLASTPEAARPEVILELESRFGIQGTAVSSPQSMDAATFAARLEPYLNLVIR